MKDDIEAQINRAYELFREQEVYYNEDIRSQEISKNLRIRTQEILQLLRNTLDQTMRFFFTQQIAPSLSSTDISSAYVIFPIRSTTNGLNKVLKFRVKYTAFQTQYPDVYRYLESIQPYNQGFEWLKTFQDKSNDKHIALSRQKLDGETATHLGKGIIKIVGKGRAIFSNCRIGDTFIKNQEVHIDTPEEEIDSGIEVKRTWASIHFENTTLDVLQFCKDAIDKVKNIIDNFISLMV